MTPEYAAEQAAAILAKAAEVSAVYPDQASALVEVAGGWTRLYVELAHAPKTTEPEPRQLTDSEELAKMRDAYRILLERGAQVEEVRDIAGQPGNWDTDEYNRGYFNGIELAAAILDGDRAPRFRDAPSSGYRPKIVVNFEPSKF